MDSFLEENRTGDGGERRGSKLPGAASLYEQLDKEILVCLRDGRTFKGFMRSYDQYANVVLENTVERLMVEDSFSDVPMGIFVIRGENVMLLGEIDAKKEAEFYASKRAVSEPEIRRALAAQKADKDSFARKERLTWPIPEDF